MAGTPGGDGATTIFEFASGSLNDAALNPASSASIEVIEIPDTIPPSIFEVTINYESRGEIIVETSETISGSKVNLSKAFLSNYVGVVYSKVDVDIRQRVNHRHQSGWNFF